MEQVVEDIENKMKTTDARLDNLAIQVGNIEQGMFAENGQEVEVKNLLKSVNDVKDNYQHLKKEITEVQDLQRQLSSSLNYQLKMMQIKCNRLKERISNAEYAKLKGRQSPATTNFNDN
ncbi:hypothetical protein ABEB36_007804 [Hypothenemus hampei]|uniref:Ska2 N-terminal domain-containing protein n=1 Tax=Hypothenemus hampei TaxID=57062 RepID=A0ABD1EVA3_HYPHA